MGTKVLERDRGTVLAQRKTTVGMSLALRMNLEVVRSSEETLRATAISTERIESLRGRQLGGYEGPGYLEERRRNVQFS